MKACRQPLLGPKRFALVCILRCFHQDRGKAFRQLDVYNWRQSDSALPRLDLLQGVRVLWLGVPISD